MSDTATNKEKTAKKGFFHKVKSEFKKIVWPDKDTLIKQSAAVIVITIVLGVIISLIDIVIKFGMDKILMIG